MLIQHGVRTCGYVMCVCACACVLDYKFWSLCMVPQQLWVSASCCHSGTEPTVYPRAHCLPSGANKYWNSNSRTWRYSLSNKILRIESVNKGRDFGEKDKQLYSIFLSKTSLSRTLYCWENTVCPEVSLELISSPLRDSQVLILSDLHISLCHILTNETLILEYS